MSAEIILLKTFALLILFQLKHFISDYPLQTPYMLGKFKEKDWLLPLSAHAAVHAIFTILISLCFTSTGVAIALGIFDFVIHFSMDRIKVSPKLLGRFTALSKREMISILNSKIDQDAKEVMLKSNKLFWWSLGLDQGVHHITHYIIILVLVL